jgi:hypothetical protein
MNTGVTYGAAPTGKGYGGGKAAVSSPQVSYTKFEIQKQLMVLENKLEKGRKQAEISAKASAKMLKNA